MQYPGNSSLGSDVRERVLNTYRQTLDLAARGNRQEASLGCDFILRLDSEFEPARTLMSRLEEGEGPVSVEDLQPGGPAFEKTSLPSPEDPFGDLDAVDLGEAGVGEELGAATTEERPEQEPELLQELRRLLAERRFEELRERAQAEEEAVAADPRLAEIVDAARSRQEAEPYVDSFLDSARGELRAGNAEQAAQFLQSARELDPEHPGLADLESLLGSTGVEGTRQKPRPEIAEDLEGAGSGLDEAVELSDLSLEDEGAASSEAAASGDDDGRIRDLLKEGQAAFGQGDYQGAIDAWSRIFLIDIDHQEAARRIEEARRLKAEQERRIEEVFHEGVSAFEDGDPETARQQFQKVLELQPNHLTAKEYLQKIEAGEAPTVPATAQEEAPPPEELPAEPVPPPPPLEEDDSEPILEEEVLIPPEPGEARPPSPPPDEGAVAPSRSNRTFLYVGAAVLVVVLVGAWVVLEQWDRFFPNANGPIASQPTQDPIARASEYHAEGKTSFAIMLLRRLGPDDPHYQEAQALITQWEAKAGQPSAEVGPEAETADGAGGEPGDTPPGERQGVTRERLLDDARQAIRNREFLRAESLLLEAQKRGDLDAGATGLLNRAREELEPIRREIELVRGGDWEFALPDLWRQREADPDNADVNRLLVTSYYNLGIRDLQRGDADAAVSQFEEAANLVNGTDPELERHLRFARAYQGRTKDLLYQIYVKYLPFR